MKLQNVVIDKSSLFLSDCIQKNKLLLADISACFGNPGVSGFQSLLLRSYHEITCGMARKATYSWKRVLALNIQMFCVYVHSLNVMKIGARFSARFACFNQDK